LAKTLKCSINAYGKNDKIRVEDLLLKIKGSGESSVFVSSKKRYSMVMQSNQKMNTFIDNTN
jgi:hypothetical protein